MRRFFGTFWTTFVAASLPLCVASAGVWVRSHLASDLVQCTNRGHGWVLASSRGRLAIARFQANRTTWIESVPDQWQHVGGEPEDDKFGPSMFEAAAWDLALPGLQWVSDPTGGPTPFLLVVHLTYPTVLSSVAPLTWLVGYRKYRRRRATRARGGLCARCGYDLRASPARCPECGCVA